MRKMRPVLLTAALALTLAFATPAHAVLEFSANIGGTPISCVDNNAGCDLNPAIGILDLGTLTPIPGVTFLGTVQLQTVGPNFLNTSTLQITNASGAPVAFTLTVGGTNFVGPVGVYSLSGSELFQGGGVVGSSISLGFFGDTANGQGADFPGDTPGVLLAMFTDTATTSPQSFSHNQSGPFVDTDLHSLTLNAIGTLNANSTLVNRAQAIETTPTATPEPSTLLLLGSALTGLGVFGRRFRKNRAA
jgi:hypothetical protein